MPVWNYFVNSFYSTLLNMYNNIAFKNIFHVFLTLVSLGGENPPHLLCISKIENYISFKGNLDQI
jgi:hypothetical protein